MKIRHYHVRVLWQQFVLKADNVDACVLFALSSSFSSVYNRIA